MPAGQLNRRLCSRHRRFKPVGRTLLWGPARRAFLPEAVGLNGGRVRFRGCVRLRFRRWWRWFEWFYAGNVTSDGHSQLPASGGDTVLKRTDVSLALVLAGNLANCPEPTLRKFKECRPGAEACVIREASNVRPLVLLHTL